MYKKLFSSCVIQSLHLQEKIEVHRYFHLHKKSHIQLLLDMASILSSSKILFVIFLCRSSRRSFLCRNSRLLRSTKVRCDCTWIDRDRLIHLLSDL